MLTQITKTFFSIMKEIFQTKSEEFVNEAIRTIALTNENGVELLKGKLSSTFESFYRQGIDAAWPWVLVNESDGTEKPFGFCWDDPGFLTEEEAVEQFKEEFETELNSLIETYLDLSEYASYEEFEKAYDDDKVEIDPIITGLYDSLYLHNRYTDYDSYYDEDFGDNTTSIMDYICEEWDNLK